MEHCPVSAQLIQFPDAGAGSAPMETLPTVAISIRQPWAWAIVHGQKDIENRSWATRFRGPVLIHASKTYDAWATETIQRLCPTFLGRPDVHLGGIVGVAEIVDCVTAHDSLWFDGPYGFVLRNARPVPFLPCRGQLGFFDVDPVLIGGAQ